MWIDENLLLHQNNMATTIYTYLHNDDLSGSRIVSMDDCMCKLYNIKRDDSSFLKDFNAELNKPALYILINETTKQAYIGETDDFIKRINLHITKKATYYTIGNRPCLICKCNLISKYRRIGHFNSTLNKYINGKGQLDCWKNRSVEKLLLKDCNSECSDSIFMFGVDAGINGKRSLLGAVLDDLSNGIDEMDNDERHRQITDKVMSDVMDRSDDDDAPIILFGTMYNQYDYQNTFVDAWEKEGLKKLKKFKFIRVTPDGKKCVCLVDIENAEGHSIAPDLYTQEKLVAKRTYFENRGKPYV